MQCTKAPPPLPDDVRRVLPQGVSSLLAELLEKSAADRPSSAEDVIFELSRYAPSLEDTGKRRARTTKPVETKAPADETRAPAAPPEARPAFDTVAMIERAFAPREVSRRTAAWVLVAVSLVAATTTYVVRRASSDSPPEPTGSELEPRP
jgi:hypothetical protein